MLAGLRKLAVRRINVGSQSVFGGGQSRQFSARVARLLVLFNNPSQSRVRMSLRENSNGKKGNESERKNDFFHIIFILYDLAERNMQSIAYRIFRREKKPESCKSKNTLEPNLS